MISSQANPVFGATVVICTLGRAHELDGCLRAVARLRYPRFEVLVVENGPPSAPTQAIAEWHGAYYLNSPRIGLSRARNDGANACHTSLVAYIDDDARPHPDWLTALAKEFDDPLVMAAGGEILPLSGDPLAESSRFVTSALQRRLVVDRETQGWFTLTNFGGIGDGCNMAFRRSAFDLWPGFDERLGRGAPLDSAEEHFSFFQLVLQGFRCVHTPEAIVWHPSPQSAAEWKTYNLSNLTNAVAYAALLWDEFPQTRNLLLRHLWERSFGPRRRGRASDAPQLSFFEKLGVVVAGMRLFRRLPEASRSAATAAVPARNAR